MNDIHPPPTIQTERLILKPLQKEDANLIPILADDRDIASTTRLPFPYTMECAIEYVERQHKGYQTGLETNLAIWLKTENEEFIGVMGLFAIDQANKKAELGYWIGKKFWGKGFTTEAAKEVLRFGFKDLKLNRISARHITRNVASCNVIKKIGMQHEGTSRQDVVKWGKFEDIENWAILASEYDQSKLI